MNWEVCIKEIILGVWFVTLMCFAYWWGWCKGHNRACKAWEQRWRNTERFAAHWQDLVRKLRNKSNAEADEDWEDRRRDDPDWWKRQ